MEKLRIRKLTETEVFRLMDVDDKYIRRMKESGVSKTRLYNAAGNSIVVGCMERIFDNLFRPQLEKENVKRSATNKDVKMTWAQLRRLFWTYNDIPAEDVFAEDRQPLHAVVVFKASNWPDKAYSLEARSYRFTSDNNCFKSYLLSQSCYADSLDGTDVHVNLSKYEWSIDYCYLL